VAPLKALCNEKFTDWRQKFTPFNLKCIELTGDTDSADDFTNIEAANIICTTPVTKRILDSLSLVNNFYALRKNGI
jgi:replicative superfamily II helicase